MRGNETSQKLLSVQVRDPASKSSTPDLGQTARKQNGEDLLLLSHAK